MNYFVKKYYLGRLKKSIKKMNKYMLDKKIIEYYEELRNFIDIVRFIYRKPELIQDLVLNHSSQLNVRYQSAEELCHVMREVVVSIISRQPLEPKVISVSDSRVDTMAWMEYRGRTSVMLFLNQFYAIVNSIETNLSYYDYDDDRASQARLIKLVTILNNHTVILVTVICVMLSHTLGLKDPFELLELVAKSNLVQPELKR